MTLSLRLLEQRGLVRNLAEPNLVAVSGETASMLAGGEIPVPVRSFRVSSTALCTASSMSSSPRLRS